MATSAALRPPAALCRPWRRPSARRPASLSPPQPLASFFPLVLQPFLPHPLRLPRREMEQVLGREGTPLSHADFQLLLHGLNDSAAPVPQGRRARLGGSPDL